ncbi:MAG TPA: tyrosine-protein phosphatase, partial [Jatrophihabitantaceae bacterium]|nr:tyrosine-protein phosphatase [Jatrophihabitantaceae bacterium]
TGVVVALALDEVGVDREAIVDDYVRTGDRLEPLLARLKASPTYASDVRRMPDEQHRPRRESMAGFLVAMDEVHGGTANWLRKQGWTEEDDAALRKALLAE